MCLLSCSVAEKRERVSKQAPIETQRAAGVLRPMRDKSVGRVELAHRQAVSLRPFSLQLGCSIPCGAAVTSEELLAASRHEVRVAEVCQLKRQTHERSSYNPLI